MVDKNQVEGIVYANHTERRAIIEFNEPVLTSTVHRQYGVKRIGVSYDATIKRFPELESTGEETLTPSEHHFQIPIKTAEQMATNYIKRLGESRRNKKLASLRVKKERLDEDQIAVAEP